VAAVDKDLQDFRKARFSNYGNDCSIAAPGVDIFSCVGNSEYATMSGTSMAAPIVTGAVALMKSINPNLTNKQIICILQGTGAQSQGDIGKMLQLDKALEAVKANQTLNCSAQPVPSTGDVQILLNWQNYNDLDLVVTDPNGETVWFKNKRVASGGKLEIDMNVEYPDSKTPFEHVFWPHQGAPSGTYNVYVLYFKKHENANENLFKVSVKYGDKTENYSGNATELKKAVRICSFTLNGSNASGPPSSERPDDIRSGDPSHRNDLENEARRLRQELDRVEAELRRISNSR
jgi:subtilisin family serine protease